MLNTREVQELRVHEDQLAHEGFRVHLVSQVSQVSTDCQEKRDHQVLGEDPVCLVCQDLRVHLVPLGKKAKLVFQEL